MCCARVGALAIVALGWAACATAPRLLRDRDPRLAVLVHVERAGLATRLRDASAPEFPREVPRNLRLQWRFNSTFAGQRSRDPGEGAIDPWGRPLQLLGVWHTSTMVRGPYGSLGPNGVDDHVGRLGDHGDDVDLVGDETAILLACSLDLGPLVLAALAWLFVGPWRAAPRARFVAVEGVRAIVRAAPLAFVAYASSPALSEALRLPAWLVPASSAVGSRAAAIGLQVLGAGALLALGLRLRANRSNDDEACLERTTTETTEATEDASRIEALSVVSVRSVVTFIGSWRRPARLRTGFLGSSEVLRPEAR